MVVNFRIHEISRDVRKLVQTPTLIYIYIYIYIYRERERERERERGLCGYIVSGRSISWVIALLKS
jgi:hypothetical protein